MWGDTEMSMLPEKQTAQIADTGGVSKDQAQPEGEAELSDAQLVATYAPATSQPSAPSSPATKDT